MSSRRKPSADRRGNNRRNDAGGRRSGQRGTTPMRGERPRSGGGASSSGGSSKPKGLGGEQVEGRHAVRELLLAGTRRTREVLFAAEMDPAPILDEIRDLAHEMKVTLREVSRKKIETMNGARWRDRPTEPWVDPASRRVCWGHGRRVAPPSCGSDHGFGNQDRCGCRRALANGTGCRHPVRAATAQGA